MTLSSTPFFFSFVVPRVIMPRAYTVLPSLPQDPHRWLDDFFEACDSIPGGCGITHLAIHSYSCEVRVLYRRPRAEQLLQQPQQQQQQQTITRPNLTILQA